MKVAVLTTDAYGAVGGIATYNRDLIEAIASLPEVEEVIVVPRTPGGESEALPAKVRVVKRASRGKAHFVAAAVRSSLEQVDVLVCGHINLLPVAGPLRLAQRCPLVLMAYGIDVWRAPGHATRMWMRQVSAVWCISAVTRDRMNAWARLSASRYVLLPNAVRLERYGVRPKDQQLLDRYQLRDKTVIMTFGRLSKSERYKGVDEVLDSMHALRREDPSIVYVVAGEGDDRPRLTQKAADLGLADCVVFTGAIKEQEKNGHYGLADAYVMPSSGEGFGFVFLEAMACGIPVVGSVIDGSREALREGLLGELVHPDDRTALVNAIRRSLMKEKSVPEGLTHFGWSAFRNRVENALHQVDARSCVPTAS